MVLPIDQQAQRLGQGHPGYQGFPVVNHFFLSNSRQCVFPPDAGGMNQGTDARFPDGSGANSRETSVVWIRPWPNHRLR